ncbi:MAG TPA: hypothetical protein PLF26_13930 [Blastocatellia bacterium]|nr:hypothetical protein [Blastocatellia bacterium]
MKTAPGRLPRCRHCIAAVAILATTGVSAAALAGAPLEYRLTIVPGEYVIGPVRSADIARVEAWLVKGDRHVVAIDRCAAATTPQLLIAVEKLEPYTSDVLEIRKKALNTLGCPASADDAIRGFLRDVDYLETDELGYSLIP